jgi:hypothetical protein
MRSISPSLGYLRATHCVTNEVTSTATACTRSTSCTFMVEYG